MKFMILKKKSNYKDKKLIKANFFIRKKISKYKKCKFNLNNRKRTMIKK